MLLTLLIIILIVVLLVFYFKYFKRLKIKNICFIDGSLGTGKSYLSLCIAYRQFKHNLRMVKLGNVWRRIRGKDPNELPLLYSNIKLNIPYVPVTLELLQRKNFRFRYKSVLYLDEFSLVLDQMCFKDKEINERASEFFKLFRHETKGGYMIINSQAISDNHYALKYVLSDYIYIHSKLTLFGRLPLGFSIMKVQERVYDSDKSTVQTNEGDIEDNLKTIFVRKKYFKMYDTYCHSVWTDDLPVLDSVNEIKDGNLKADDLVSFKQLTYLKENLKKEEKQNEQKMGEKV